MNDTLLQIQNASANNTLKRPLKVKFIGEEGVDEGGVQKVRVVHGIDFACVVCRCLCAFMSHMRRHNNTAP